MVVFLIVIIIIVYWLNDQTKNTLKKLVYNREVSKRVIEVGEVFHMTTIVENFHFLPISLLQIKEQYPKTFKFINNPNTTYTPQILRNRQIMMMRPFQRIKRIYQLTGHQRGKHIFKDVGLTMGDFVGLKTYSKYIEALQDIVVVPSATDFNKVLAPHGEYHGPISVRRWIIEDPILSIGVREYTGNEPMKSIHWPSSAKTGDLMVKNYDYTTDNNSIVLLNSGTDKVFNREVDIDKIEKCYSIARTVVDELEGMRMPYGLATNIEAIKHFWGKNISNTGYGPAHYNNILEALGRGDYNANISFNQLLASFIRGYGKHSTFIIITPSIKEENIDSINRLSKTVGRIIIISLDGENVSKINNKAIKFIGS